MDSSSGQTLGNFFCHQYDCCVFDVPICAGKEENEVSDTVLALHLL
jgi:hypothetical protein